MTKADFYILVESFELPGVSESARKSLLEDASARNLLALLALSSYSPREHLREDLTRRGIPARVVSELLDGPPPATKTVATRGYRLNGAFSLKFFQEPLIWYPKGWTTDVDLFDDAISKARAATSNEKAQRLLQVAESFFWRSPRPTKARSYPLSIQAAFDAVQKQRFRFLKRRVALMIVDGDFDNARDLASSSAEHAGLRSKPGKQFTWLRRYCEWRSGSVPVRSSRDQPHRDKNLGDWAIGFWLNYVVPITLEFRCERLAQLQNPNRLTSDFPAAAQLPLLLHSLDVRHPPDLTWPLREPTQPEIVVLAEAALAAATANPSDKQLVQAIRAIGLISRMTQGSRNTALLEISRHPNTARVKRIRRAIENRRVLYDFKEVASDKTRILDEIVAAAGSNV